MSKRMRVLALLLCFVFALTMSACKEEERKAANLMEKISVGLIVSSDQNPFFQKLILGAEEAAQENGIQLEVFSSDNSISNELDHVKTLVAKNVNAILINPCDSDAVFEAIRYANMNDTPIFTVDRASSGGRVISHIGSNNEDGGAKAAALIIELCGNTGKYAEIRGIEGNTATTYRSLGFNNYMIANGKMAQAAVVTADFDRDLGEEMMAKIIEVHPDLKAVFLHNDEMALGAVRAAKRMNSSVVIVGFDGTDEALDAVKAGDMAATIAQQPELLGRTAVEKGIAYLKGEMVEDTVLVDTLPVKK